MNKKKSGLLAAGVVTAALSLSALVAAATSDQPSHATGRVAAVQAGRSGEGGTPTGVLSWGWPIGWGSEHEARLP